jgi:hypothetical protein
MKCRSRPEQQQRLGSEDTFSPQENAFLTIKFRNRGSAARGLSGNGDGRLQLVRENQLPYNRRRSKNLPETKE